VLHGACDALFTPSPLGPFLDVAEQLGGGLQELVAEEARPHAVAAALARELREAKPTVLVLEDVWHPRLVTLHVWLWYPNPDGLYASTNPLVAPLTDD
jgi:hypothetical protein